MGTVVKRPYLHVGLLEITLTVPLKGTDYSSHTLMINPMSYTYNISCTLYVICYNKNSKGSKYQMFTPPGFKKNVELKF